MSEANSQNEEAADAAMNDHVMNAKMTVGVSCPQGTRRRAILHKSVSLTKNTRTLAEAEAASSEPIAMNCIKHTHYFSLRIKHTHHYYFFFAN
jgi:hypothetical protein